MKECFLKAVREKTEIPCEYEEFFNKEFFPFATKKCFIVNYYEKCHKEKKSNDNFLKCCKENLRQKKFSKELFTDSSYIDLSVKTLKEFIDLREKNPNKDNMNINDLFDVNVFPGLCIRDKFVLYRTIAEGFYNASFKREYNEKYKFPLFANKFLWYINWIAFYSCIFMSISLSKSFFIKDIISDYRYFFFNFFKITPLFFLVFELLEKPINPDIRLFIIQVRTRRIQAGGIFQIIQFILLLRGSFIKKEFFSWSYSLPEYQEKSLPDEYFIKTRLSEL
jgi:hypothetical protein